MSTRRGKPYTTSYKEREKAKQDPYTMLKAPGGPLVCPDCHAIFAKKRWYLDEAEFAKLSAATTTRKSRCPACQKIRDDYPEGIVTLKWPDLAVHEAEIRGLIFNEEARALAVNPLARVMRVTMLNKQTMEILTTNDRLAQRIGRELVRAFGGQVAYRWAHKDVLLRVEWAGPGRAAHGQPQTAKSPLSK